MRVRSLSLSLLPVLFQNQSAHRSSIIQSLSLHCFSFCLHIHHLASAYLVELYLFLESAHDDGEVLTSLCSPLMMMTENRCCSFLHVSYWLSDATNVTFNHRSVSFKCLSGFVKIPIVLYNKHSNNTKVSIKQSVLFLTSVNHLVVQHFRPLLRCRNNVSVYDDLN